MRRMELGFRKKNFLLKSEYAVSWGRCVVLEFIKTRCYFKEKHNTPYLINQMCRIVCISTEQRQQFYAEKFKKTKNKQKYRKKNMHNIQ